MAATWQGKFEEPRDPALDHELMLIEVPVEPGGTWFKGPVRVDGVLHRSPDGRVSWVPGWESDHYSGADPQELWDDWSYKGGGNGYSIEIGFVYVDGDHVQETIAQIDQTLRRDRSSVETTVAPVRPSEPVTERAPDESTSDGDDQPSWGVPPHLAHVLTWQLAAQLVRRHPHRLWPTNTWPLDGFYDCLALIDVSHPDMPVLAQFNRNGTAVSVTGGRLARWTSGWDCEDPRDWILEIEAAMGLEAPRAGLPASTPSSLATRWIAAFMRLQLGSRERWYSTGRELDEREAAEFQGLDLSRSVRRQHWILGTGSVGVVQDLKVVVGREGTAYQKDRAPVDLAGHHTSGGSITALVVSTVPHLLD